MNYFIITLSHSNDHRMLINLYCDNCGPINLDKGVYDCRSTKDFKSIIDSNYFTVIYTDLSCSNCSSEFNEEYFNNDKFLCTTASHENIYRIRVIYNKTYRRTYGYFCIYDKDFIGDMNKYYDEPAILICIDSKTFIERVRAGTIIDMNYDKTYLSDLDKTYLSDLENELGNHGLLLRKLPVFRIDTETYAQNHYVVDRYSLTKSAVKA